MIFFEILYKINANGGGKLKTREGSGEGALIETKSKKKQQLLPEMEELRTRLDATERRLQEANELLQAQIAERKRAEETLT